MSESGINYLYGAYKCHRNSLLKLVDWSVEIQDLHNLQHTHTHIAQWLLQYNRKFTSSGRSLSAPRPTPVEKKCF